jgi:hypothetical protein
LATNSNHALRWQFAALRCEGHQNAPRERDAEHHLRKIREALHERVQRGDQHGKERQLDRQRVGEQQQHETQRTQGAEHQQCFVALHGAGDKRASLCARHTAIEARVGKVIDGATRRTHQRSAKRKDQEQVQIGKPFGCNPQRAKRRPQQKVDADGAVESCQRNEGRQTRAGPGKPGSKPAIENCRAGSNTCLEGVEGLSHARLVI